MEKEAMHPKAQLDVADINHVEHNSDQPFNAFHDWPTTAEVTSKDKTVCYVDEQDKQRRSDSFSDEWQDHTSEVTLDEPQVTPQHKSLELDNGVDFDVVDFTSLSKTVLPQCFHSKRSCDNSSSREKKFDPNADQ